MTFEGDAGLITTGQRGGHQTATFGVGSNEDIDDFCASVYSIHFYTILLVGSLEHVFSAIPTGNWLFFSER